MKIDPSTETLITFAELAASLPSRRRNCKVHVSTVHRWRNSGLKGIRLEALRIGGAWCTTWEAFARFCAQLTAIETGDSQLFVSSSSRRAKHQLEENSLVNDGW
ncbi:DUF1580 domain-containing protein [uncultured Rubinisphaera sp.]|uniref:DUF1580 domain-containing protein n=1 Tax=uncultured Rubinisphaera sp. TaxID=1678686 RepID=UPI000ECE7084|nr:hypothetical protein [Planctomycetaceae bacterium]|tara:strand:+ start:654 stop:965 length:312 start_codon:yes stop_codon:yes gene_type:complete